MLPLAGRSVSGYTVGMRSLRLALVLSCVPPAVHAASPEDERIWAYTQACAKAASPGSRTAGLPGAPETYFLSVEKGFPRVDADVDLRYWPGMTDQELAQAELLMDESRKAIRRFYANYGLIVEPVFHHVRDEKPAGKNHYVVYLARHLEGMSAMNWGVNASWPARERGMIHTHEFGHVLGLKDEYETLMAERLGEPDNIMRTWNAPDGRLYLRQIKTILARLCPGI